jgi:hypothetical protein
MANVLKKIRNLRLRKALLCGEIPFPERASLLCLRARESELICAEFTGFFGMFATVFLPL